MLIYQRVYQFGVKKHGFLQLKFPPIQAQKCAEKLPHAAPPALSVSVGTSLHPGFSKKYGDMKTNT